jgi:hypothetical protein
MFLNWTLYVADNKSTESIFMDVVIRTAFKLPIVNYKCAEIISLNIKKY